MDKTTTEYTAIKAKKLAGNKLLAAGYRVAYTGGH